MNKEELEKYTVDFMNNETGSNWSKLNSVMGKMLIRYAEIFQKRIAELEHQLTHRNCLDCSNHSSKLRMRTLELEKENAELKSIADFQTSSNMDRYFQLKRSKEQLTKAKEHIQTLIFCLIDWVQEGDKDYCYITEAEQFLKDSEVEK